MGKMIKKLLIKYNKIIVYGLITVFISAVDIAIVRILSLSHVEVWIANTIGVLVGSIIQYILSLKYAFKKEHSTYRLFVHIGTFLIGLVIADLVVHYMYIFLQTVYSEQASFYLAKFSSMVATFFISYGIRKKLY